MSRSPEGPLKPDRAFLVQLRPAGGGRRRLRGRIEHVVSGTSEQFTSLAALLEFMERHAPSSDRHAPSSDRHAPSSERPAPSPEQAASTERPADASDRGAPPSRRYAPGDHAVASDLAPPAPPTAPRARGRRSDQ